MIPLNIVVYRMKSFVFVVFQERRNQAGFSQVILLKYVCPHFPRPGLNEFVSFRLYEGQ